MRLFLRFKTLPFAPQPSLLRPELSSRTRIVCPAGILKGRSGMRDDAVRAGFENLVRTEFCTTGHIVGPSEAGIAARVQEVRSAPARPLPCPQPARHVPGSQRRCPPSDSREFVLGIEGERQTLPVRRAAVAVVSRGRVLIGSVEGLACALERGRVARSIVAEAYLGFTNTAPAAEGEKLSGHKVVSS